MYPHEQRGCDATAQSCLNASTRAARRGRPGPVGRKPMLRLSVLISLAGGKDRSGWAESEGRLVTMMLLGDASRMGLATVVAG